MLNLFLTEIGEWLEDHHASVQADNGEEYHVFAVTGSPSFGGPGPVHPKYKVDIHVPIRSVIFIVSSRSSKVDLNY